MVGCNAAVQDECSGTLGSHVVAGKATSCGAAHCRNAELVICTVHSGKVCGGAQLGGGVSVIACEASKGVEGGGTASSGGVQAQEAVVSGVHESGIEYAESSDKPWWKCRQLG